MKKKNLSSIFALAMIAIAGYGITKSVGNNQVVLNDLALANMEALAKINPECPNGCVIGEGGCYCFRDYDEFAEYK